MADAEEQDKNRFAYLLEPIRDLQKNWNIDLVDLLEKYLHELENGGSGGAVNEALVANGAVGPFLNSQQQRFYTNFAEAALLIQGSAQVYCRKVEYLYQLVFKLWDLLSNKNSKGRRADVAEDSASDENNVDARQKNSSYDDEPFESLDDIQIAGNIDLNESVDCRNVNEKSPKLITPMPLALIPLEDFEKSNVPLVVKSGEIIGKKDDYRVNTCFLHSTGTLLLDLSNSKLIDVRNGAEDDDAVRIKPRVLSQQNLLPPLFVLNDHNASGLPCQESPDSGTPYPGGTSPALPENTVVEHHDDDFQPLSPPLGGRPDFPTPAVGAEMNRVACLSQRKENAQIADILPSEDEHSKRKRIVAEFWTELDRYEVNGKHLEHPVRKGRTFKIPDELAPPKKAGRKRKLEDENANESKSADVESKLENCNLPKQTLSEFFKDVVYNKRRQFPKNPLNVPVFGELDDLFWDEHKRRGSVQLKQRNKKLAESKSIENFTEIRNFDEQPANALPCVDDGEEDIDDSQLDRNLHAIFDGSFEEEDATDGMPGEPLRLNDEDFHPAMGTLLSVGDENQNRRVADDFDDAAASSPPMDDERSMDRFPVYEDYVEHMVKKYLVKAQQSAALSDLTKRVVEWEEKIRPHLEVEERRRSFDIRIYGDEILDYFKDGACAEIMFCDLARGKEQFEVCRLLLAALMLVNQGNVEVSQSYEFEESVNTMKLKFLTAERHYVQLEELFGAAAGVQKN